MRPIILLTLPFCLSLSLAACGKGEASVEDSGGNSDGADGSDGTDGNDGGDGGDGTDGASETAPEVLSAKVCCYPNVSDGAYYWAISATCDDPQGADTIEGLYDSGIKVTQSGTDIASYAIVCRDGACTGTFSEIDDNVACANVSAYTFAISVIDDEGNLSAPLEVTATESTSAACE